MLYLITLPRKFHQENWILSFLGVSILIPQPNVNSQVSDNLIYADSIVVFPKDPTFSGTDDYEASYSDYEADGSLQAYNNSRGPGHTWGRGEDKGEGDNNNKGHK